ncbi:hypothetical protein [Neorhizobium sp. T25_27]|uniref:hypothetical protein n=1 Tax=Neorhizobium sp. T25_27 TaxID=2093831 RepID=UPI000CF8C98C|nr:hypothetical protein [Neorhizobium sp. T25_27]
MNLADWALLPPKPDWAAGSGKTWAPGEAGAQEGLRDIIDRKLYGYKRGLDLPSTGAAPLLSPHLAHGGISPARI